MESFEKALEAGLNWVEFDIQLTADGTLVVIHDETLERTTNGHGLVYEHTLAELKPLTPPIPTLSELLLWSQKMGCHLNIEIKPAPHNTIQTTEALLRELASLQKPIPTPIISSFHHECLQYYALQRTEPTGYLMESLDWPLINTLNPKKNLIHCAAIQAPGAFEKLKSLGFDVLVYTVNDPTQAQTLFSQGVKGIFTDCLRPGTLV